MIWDLAWAFRFLLSPPTGFGICLTDLTELGPYTASNSTGMFRDQGRGKGLYLFRPFILKMNRISDCKAFMEQNPVDKTLTDQSPSLELHGCVASMLSALRRLSKDTTTAGYL